jgi:hypothetical protein
MIENQIRALILIEPQNTTTDDRLRGLDGFRVYRALFQARVRIIVKEDGPV